MRCRMIPGYQWLTVDMLLLNDNPSHCHRRGKLIQEEDVASFQYRLLEYYRLSSMCTENPRAVTSTPPWDGLRLFGARKQKE